MVISEERGEISIARRRRHRSRADAEDLRAPTAGADVSSSGRARSASDAAEQDVV